MAIASNLIVLQEARRLVVLCRQIKIPPGFGDIRVQLDKATVSTASNIAEGAASGSDRRYAAHVKIARGSVNEAEVQLLILGDCEIISHEHEAIELSQRIGKRLTCLLRRLQPG